MLDGTVVMLNVPDALTMPPPTAIGVLRLDGAEVELTASDADGAAYFAEVTRTPLGAPTPMRNGRSLRTGPLGGDAALGLGFVLEVGSQRVFGSVPPAVSRTDLARWLGRIQWKVVDSSVQADLTGVAEWVPERPQVLAQEVDLEGGGNYLLDVRRARGRRRERRAGSGGRARGGDLYRSAQDETRPHVILEADDFVAYGIPMPATPIDDVVSSMLDVTTTTE